MGADNTATKEPSSDTDSAMNDKATAQPMAHASGIFDPSDRLFGWNLELSLGIKNPQGMELSSGAGVCSERAGKQDAGKLSEANNTDRPT